MSGDSQSPLFFITAMMKIGVMSDTHAFLDLDVLEFMKDVDEIWHAGDFGSEEVLDYLESFKPLRAVYGNCDSWNIRYRTEEIQRFTVEGLDVVMTHIGGYPGRYECKIQEILDVLPPKLFISGHSHILKVMNDQKYGLLHINPGAAGNYGFHKVMTCVRFDIDDGVIKNLEVFEKDKFPKQNNGNCKL